MDLAGRNRLAVDHLRLADGLAFKHAIRMGGDHDEMRGVARLKLVEATRRFDPRRGIPFSAFAHIRIRGALMDETRRGFRRVQTDPLDEAPDIPVIDATDDLNVWDAVERLPGKEQAVLRMRFSQDMGLRQIGEFFGVTESRACQMVGRALKMLREVIA